MACQLMSGHHLLFRPSRKCSKLIISAALPPRSRASPAPQIRIRLAHPDPVITTLACVSNRHYYYYYYYYMYTVQDRTFYAKINKIPGSFGKL